MKNPDLHLLANSGGAGVAQKLLQQSGHWDENARMPVWEVEVDAMVRATRTIKVRAACAQDAQSRAYEMADEDSPDWEIDTSFVDVFEAKVTAVPT